MTGAGWQRDDLFETRDPKPGEDYGPGESLLLFGDVLGTGTVAGERYVIPTQQPQCVLRVYKTLMPRLWLLDELQGFLWTGAGPVVGQRKPLRSCTLFI